MQSPSRLCRNCEAVRKHQKDSSFFTRRIEILGYALPGLSLRKLVQSTENFFRKFFSDWSGAFGDGERPKIIAGNRFPDRAFGVFDELQIDGKDAREISLCSDTPDARVQRNRYEGSYPSGETVRASYRGPAIRE